MLNAGERRVGWLRIAAIGLIVAAERLPHPHPNRSLFETAAAVALGYALVVLAYTYLRVPGRRVSFAATAADVLAISVLAYLSGGAYSEARLAYFLIPISVAFRFGWRLTLAATALVILAYDLQAATHPARHIKDATGFVGVQTGYLLWIGAAASLLSALLAGRTQRLVQLARGRRQLLAEVMGAEERERQELAEALHDHAIQSLLAARQDVDEALKSGAPADLDRVRTALTETLDDLRGTIFELHPHVLQHAGLEPALKAVAERASRRGRFDVELCLDYPRRHPEEALLLGAARELLANVARHAHATRVSLALAEEDGGVSLVARDDGIGFDPAAIDHSVASGHIGLLSQRERIEASGGRFEIRSSPGRGTEIAVWLPLRQEPLPAERPLTRLR